MMAGAKIKNMEEFAAVSGISRPTISKYFNDPDSVLQMVQNVRSKIFRENERRQAIREQLANPALCQVSARSEPIHKAKRARRRLFVHSRRQSFEQSDDGSNERHQGQNDSWPCLQRPVLTLPMN